MSRLEEIEKRKAEIVDKSKSASVEELDNLIKEMDGLNKEIEEIRKKEQEKIEKRKEIAEKINNGEIETKVIEEKKNKINLVEKRGNEKMENKLDSVEYRNAFIEFAKTGVMAEEFRDVAMTANNSAVIPVTTLNKIVEKLESFGNILPLVTYMNYPAGVAVPTSQLASPAVWTTDADVAKNGIAVDGKVTGSITFGAYPLVKALGLSFMAQVQSLSAFETALANNVADAMAKAMEKAIVDGTGVGQMKGILAETPAKTVALSNKLSFADVVNIKKSIPAAYRSGAVLVMNESTFYEFYGMTDANGQPIARVNFGVDKEPEYMLFGQRVVVTDWMKDYETAKSSDVVAFAVQLDKYVINTAHQIDLVTYIDNATRNKVYQSFAALDGKLVDANGLVFVTKGTGKA